MTIQANDFSQSPRPRWRVLLAGGLCFGTLVGLGVQSVREVNAADDQEDAIRKALDNLKNGAPPAAKDDKNKPSDLNPVDQLRRDQEALNAARKKLQDNPDSEEARKEVADLEKRVAEGMRNNRFGPMFPNFPVAPIVPGNPADLDRDLQRMVEQQRRVMEEQMRMLQQNRMMFNGRLNGFSRRGDGRLGVRIERPSPTLIDQLNLPEDQGIVVLDVMPDSPAEKAGLKPHDIILEVDGKKMSQDAAELQQVIRELKPDAKIVITVLRKGKKESIKEVAIPALGGEAANPAFPNPQLFPNLPVPNRLGLGVVPNGNGRVQSIAVTMNNGEFTIKMNDDGVKYTVVGIKDDGGLQPSLIEVDDNGTIHKTDKIEKLNEAYRPAVEKLLKQIR